jgi:hypothetical protein
VPVVEPVVTEEKLRQLLDEGSESAQLDFKQQLDLSVQRDKVELAKDVGAMQVNGGYIVVGATDGGEPTRAMTAAMAARFDEASVRDIVKKWIPEPFDIRIGRHLIDDRHLVLIYVGPNPDGMCVFAADGQYSEDGGKSTTVFRAGDIYARHGSKSERMAQHDIARIVRRLVAAEKDRWGREVIESFQPQLVQGLQAQQLAHGPITNYALQLPIDTFEATTVEVLRADDDMALRRVLNDATSTASQEVHREGAMSEKLEPLLDRVAAVVAIALTYVRRTEFDLAVATLVRLYELGFDRSGYRDGTLAVQPERLWLAVMERVMAVGALAVRQQQWWAVRALAMQLPQAEGVAFYNSWVRHAVTEAARANLFLQTGQGGQVEVSLLYLAKEVIDGVPALRPDVAATDERILDSLCQFDLLAAVAAIDVAGSADTRYFYTSFARFDSARVQPILRRLLIDPQLREAVFAGDDAMLAHALRELLRLASSEAARFSRFFVQYDHFVQQFIANNDPGS